jgi:hypothetical protein
MVIFYRRVFARECSLLKKVSTFDDFSHPQMFFHQVKHKAKDITNLGIWGSQDVGRGLGGDIPLTT